MTTLNAIADELKKTPSNRAMSPVEIGRFLAETASRDGVVTATAGVGLKDQGTVKQFIRVLDLPEDLQAKVAWKRAAGSLPFTVAAEVARLTRAEDAQDLWSKAVAQKMTKKDVREAIGLYACRSS